MPWSDWQDGFDAQFTVTPDEWPLYVSRLSTSYDEGDPTTPQAALNAARDAIMAGGGTQGTASVDEYWVAEVGPQSSGGGEIFIYGQNVALGYRGANYEGSVYADQLPSSLPAALSGLTPGVDYDEIPGWDGSDPLEPNQYVQYATSDTAFVGVGDVDLTFGGFFLISYPLDSGEDYTTPDIIPFTMWVKALDTGQDAAAPGRAWLPYEDGTVVQHYDYPTPEGDTDTLGRLYGAETVTINTSGGAVTDADFALVIQSRYADPTTDAGPIVPGATFDGHDFKGYNYAANSFGFGSLSTVTVSYHTGAWRYWIPDAGPLRTIGDHFRSVGGADVKSLIPGVGWVKVRRGT